MEFAVRKTVVGIDAGEGRIEIEMPIAHAGGHLVSIGAEVASVAGVRDERKSRRASRCGKADHAGQGVGAIERAVRLAQDLDGLDAYAGEVGEFYRASDGVGRNAIDQHLVCVGLSSADIETGGAAHLSRLRHLEAGHQTQRVLHLRRIAKVFRRNHSDGRAYLRFGRWSSGRGDGDLLRKSLSRQCDIQFNSRSLPRDR